MAEREIKVTFKSQTKQLNDGVKEVTSNVQKMITTGKKIKTITEETTRLTDKINGLGTVTKKMSQHGGHGFFDSLFGKMFGALSAERLAENALGAIRDGIKETIGGVIEFEDKISDMKETMGLTNAEALKLKSGMLDAGIYTGQSVKTMEALAQGAWETSHDIDFVTRSLKFMGELQHETGSDALELGKGMGEIAQQTGYAGDKLEEFIKPLALFGREKGVKMSLKTLFPDMRSSLNTFKLLNPKASFEGIQKYFMESMWVGSPGTMNRAYKNLLQPKVRGMLRALNFDLTKNTPDVLSVISRVMERPGAYTSKISLLSGIFGKKVVADLVPLIGHINDLKEAEKKAIVGDWGAGEPTFAKAMNSINDAFLKLTDSAFAAPLKEFADQLVKFSKDPAMMENLTNLAKNMEKIAEFAIKAAGAMGLIIEGVTSLPANMLGGKSSAAQADEIEQTRLYAWIQRASTLKSKGDIASLRKAEKLDELIAQGYTKIGDPNNALRFEKLATKINNEINVYVAGEKKEPEKIVTKKHFSK